MESPKTRTGLQGNDLDPITGKRMYEVCQTCNYDRHICPGCGASIAHGEGACDRCIAELDR